MSGTQPQHALDSIPTLPNPDELTGRTHDFAQRIGEAIAEPYLAFRRNYYHETAPSLATEPPPDSSVQRTETATLAQRALQVFPRELHMVPVMRELLDHLQWVVDLHSITAGERRAIHNLTMTVLRGLQGGVQPWLVEWMLFAAHRLQSATDARYYMTYPWQALLYRAPHELAAFDQAMRAGDVTALAGEVERLAGQLIEVLHNPLAAQPKLIFTGPDGERRKLMYELKTSAALALGAYLAVDAVRGFLHHDQLPTTLPSVLHELPPALAGHISSDDTGA